MSIAHQGSLCEGLTHPFDTFFWNRCHGLQDPYQGESKLNQS